MSNDIIVTICGFTGTSPELRLSGDGSRPWTQFRLASTPSVRGADGKWRDLETTWLTVKAFGRLAENLCYSVRKPDPLIVSGRLRTEAWEDRDGNARTSLTLIAEAVGHDLSFGKASFARVVRAASDAATDTAAAAEDLAAVEGGATTDGCATADACVVTGASGPGVNVDDGEGAESGDGGADAGASRTYLGVPVGDAISREFDEGIAQETVSDGELVGASV